MRNFIPAKYVEDQVLGLYDTVNNVFYTNAGASASAFIAGPAATSIGRDETLYCAEINEI